LLVDLRSPPVELVAELLSILERVPPIPPSSPGQDVDLIVHWGR